MKEMIADGVIGEVKEVHSAGKQDHRGGGEDLMVLGTHALDLLCFLFGRPRWVQSYILQDGHDAGPDDARQGDEEIGPIVGDHLQATYAFDNDIIATFSSRSRDVRPGPRPGGLAVYGTEGILLHRDGFLLHCPHPIWSPAFAEPAWKVVVKPSNVGFDILNAFIVRDLIAAFEEGREPISSGTRRPLGFGDDPRRLHCPPPRAHAAAAGGPRTSTARMGESVAYSAWRVAL